MINYASSGNGHERIWGVFPEWPMGTDCKSVFQLSVVRIHPRSSNKKNPNLFPIEKGSDFLFSGLRMAMLPWTAWGNLMLCQTVSQQQI